MPLKNYIHLAKNFTNWPLYFKQKYFKSDANPVYVTKGNNLAIEVPAHFFFVFKEIFMEDFYEIDELMKHVPASPVVVDIGANVGFFSFLIAAKAKNAKVFAFEPMTINQKLFQENLRRNKDVKHAITVEQKAVTGIETPSVKLFFDDRNENTEIPSVFADFSKENTQSTEVPAISLKKIIEQNQLQSIDVLKLDCEGSEYPILYNSPEEIWPLIKCLCIEVHEIDTATRNYKSLSAFLTNKNFKIKSRLDANGCYYLLAWK